jgi:phospholipid/cholesterol/gamma-HCH transport system substrate-binding protein
VSLDTTIGEVKRDVQVLTDLLQSVLDQKTVTSLKHSIDNLQKVTQTLTANSEKLDAMIVNAERASSNAERASRQVKPLLDSSQETVEALQGEILPEAYDTLVKLHDLSTSLQKITAEIDRDPSVLVRGKSPPPPGPGEKPWAALTAPWRFGSGSSRCASLSGAAACCPHPGLRRESDIESDPA